MAKIIDDNVCSYCRLRLSNTEIEEKECWSCGASLETKEERTE